MNIPLLQTKNWQKLQSDLGETTFFEQNQDVQYLAIKKSTPVGDYLYLPYGPHFFEKPSLKTVKNAFKGLLELAKRENAIFIRVEPQNASALRYLRENGIKSHDLNPADTWILDISGEEVDFKAKLPSRLLRYYKNREKSGLEIIASKNPDDIDFLVNLQQNLAKNKKISTFSADYLKTELKQPFATLYLVQDNGTRGDANGISADVSEAAAEKQAALAREDGPSERRVRKNAVATPNVLAAGLVFDDGDTRYNLQGAQSPAGAKLHATGILTIQLILDARAKNLKNFDFWGIAPENAPKNHPWAGFTGFKKTFAGTEFHYCGTWDIPVNRGKYRLYQIFRTLNRVIRKIK